MSNTGNFTLHVLTHYLVLHASGSRRLRESLTRWRWTCSLSPRRKPSRYFSPMFLLLRTTGSSMLSRSWSEICVKLSKQRNYAKHMQAIGSSLSHNCMVEWEIMFYWGCINQILSICRAHGTTNKINLADGALVKEARMPGDTVSPIPSVLPWWLHLLEQDLIQCVPSQSSMWPWLASKCHHLTWRADIPVDQNDIPPFLRPSYTAS